MLDSATAIEHLRLLDDRIAAAKSRLAAFKRDGLDVTLSDACLRVLLEEREAILASLATKNASGRDRWRGTV